jgi:hypothetical protein
MIPREATPEIIIKPSAERMPTTEVSNSDGAVIV